MDFNINIDIDSLRDDVKSALTDYYGTAMQYNPQAVIELSKVDRISDADIVDIAIQSGVNISDYETNGRSR